MCVLCRHMSYNESHRHFIVIDEIHRLVCILELEKKKEIKKRKINFQKALRISPWKNVSRWTRIDRCRREERKRERDKGREKWYERAARERDSRYIT